MWGDCQCRTVTRLRGPEAIEYARRHLRQIPRDFELHAGSMRDDWGEWECAETGIRWHHTAHRFISGRDFWLLRYPPITVDDLRDESSWTARAAAFEAERAVTRETVGHLERAEQDWVLHTGWFEALNAMYPRIWKRYVKDLQLGGTDPRAAIAFLRADPWCRYSGYWKMKVSVAVTRVPLDSDQLETLRDVVLATVAKGSRREFPQTTLLAKRIWDDRLESAAIAMRESGDEWLKRAATLLVKKRYTN
jgi:hypothetical protein